MQSARCALCCDVMRAFFDKVAFEYWDCGWCAGAMWEVGGGAVLTAGLCGDRRRLWSGALVLLTGGVVVMTGVPAK